MQLCLACHPKTTRFEPLRFVDPREAFNEFFVRPPQSGSLERTWQVCFFGIYRSLGDAGQCDEQGGNQRENMSARHDEEILNDTAVALGIHYVSPLGRTETYLTGELLSDVGKNRLNFLLAANSLCKMISVIVSAVVFAREV